MTTITVTQLNNSLESYLEMAANGETFIVTKDGVEVCEIKPRIEAKLAVFDSLTGMAKGVNVETAKEEKIAK